MLKIAVVEDENTAREFLTEMITGFFTEKQQSFRVVPCESSEEFLFKYSEPGCFDLIFTDIMLGNMNGMELAKRIRETDRNVTLVFLTGVKEYVFDGYKIGALRYLLKPVKREELNELLTEFIRKMETQKDDQFLLPFQGESLRLSFSDIIYVQVDGHYVRMKTSGREYEWKGSLAKAKMMLRNKEFVSVNRSTIVNLSYVNRITREFCYLENGEEFPVSRNEYSELNEAFLRFYL